jgi:hypothetical protein
MVGYLKQTIQYELRHSNVKYQDLIELFGVIAEHCDGDISVAMLVLVAFQPVVKDNQIPIDELKVRLTDHEQFFNRLIQDLERDHSETYRKINWLPAYPFEWIYKQLEPLYYATPVGRAFAEQTAAGEGSVGRESSSVAATTPPNAGNYPTDFKLGIPNYLVDVHGWVIYGRWELFRIIFDSCMSEARDRTLILSELKSRENVDALVHYLYTGCPSLFKTSENCAVILDHKEFLGFLDLNTTDQKPLPEFEKLIDHCAAVVAGLLSRRSAGTRPSAPSSAAP